MPLPVSGLPLRGGAPSRVLMFRATGTDVAGIREAPCEF